MAKLYTSEYDVFKGSFLIVQAEFGLLRLQPLGLVHSPLLQYEKTSMSYLTFTVMKGNIKLSNCQRGVVWYMKIAHIVFEVRPGLVECVEWMLQLIFNIARMNEWHCAVSVKYVFRWSERSLQAVGFGVNWWLVLTPLFPPSAPHGFLSCCGCQVAPGGPSRAIKLVWLQTSDSWCIRQPNNMCMQ